MNNAIRVLWQWWVERVRCWRPERANILDLAGMGAGVWADEDPDEYVRRLREGWE